MLYCSYPQQSFSKGSLETVLSSKSLLPIFKHWAVLYSSHCQGQNSVRLLKHLRAKLLIFIGKKESRRTWKLNMAERRFLFTLDLKENLVHLILVTYSPD